MKKIAVATLVVAVLALVFTGLTFFASITSWFKHSIPIESGFLVNDRILQNIELSTGDPAKPILLRFRNLDKGTLTGVVLELRFHRPVALSGTEQAIAIPVNFIAPQIKHGGTPEYYLIQLSQLIILGYQDMDLRVELNTRNIVPGTYKVDVVIGSIKQNYKDTKAGLSITLK